MNRIMRLVVGSLVMGGGLAIAIKSGFGADPMALFWEGVHLRTALSLGTVNLLVSAVMIAVVCFADRSQIGVGTILNPLIVSAVMDFLGLFLPAADLPAVGFIYLALGLTLLAAGISYYGSAKLGRGTFEGLVFGFAHKTGFSIRVIRISADLMLALMGMFLGARLSLGAVLSILMMGPLIQFFCSHLDINS